MATVQEHQRNGYISYTVRWRTADRKYRRKTFYDRESAEQFAATRVASTRKPWGLIYTSMAERIRQSVVVDAAGCWIWQRQCMPIDKYGLISVREDGKPKTRLAHRVSYETFVGPIPDGLQIDHLCRVRPCINPDHLEPVTQRENILRSPVTQAALNAAKSHCPQGHPYNKGNTYLYRGGRICKSCALAHHQRYRARQKSVNSDA